MVASVKIFWDSLNDQTKHPKPHQMECFRLEVSRNSPAGAKDRFTREKQKFMNVCMPCVHMGAAGDEVPQGVRRTWVPVPSGAKIKMVVWGFCVGESSYGKVPRKSMGKQRLFSKVCCNIYLSYLFFKVSSRPKGELELTTLGSSVTCATDFARL